METYVKPMMRAIAEDAGSCGCNFHFNETPDCRVGEIPPVVSPRACVSVETGPINPTIEPDAKPIFSNTILGVSDGGIQVTPLANTGLPGTQPIYFGVPLGTRGVYVDASAQGIAIANGPAIGAAVAGNEILIPLP